MNIDETGTLRLLNSHRDVMDRLIAPPAAKPTPDGRPAPPVQPEDGRPPSSLPKPDSS